MVDTSGEEDTSQVAMTPGWMSGGSMEGSSTAREDKCRPEPPYRSDLRATTYGITEQEHVNPQ